MARHGKCSPNLRPNLRHFLNEAIPSCAVRGSRFRHDCQRGNSVAPLLQSLKNKGALWRIRREYTVSQPAIVSGPDSHDRIIDATAFRHFHFEGVHSTTATSRARWANRSRGIVVVAHNLVHGVEERTPLERNWELHLRIATREPWTYEQNCAIAALRSGTGPPAATWG
jgi:hypothetical protein